MKIALITDTHFGYRNDSVTLLQSFDKYFSEFFFPFLQAEGIKTVIHLGDVFDRRKFVNFATFEMARTMFFDKLKRAGIEMHIIIGNHDIFYKETNDVNSPRLLLQDYGFKIYESATYVDLAGRKVLFVPWITPENQSSTFNTIAEDKVQYIFGHLEINGCEHMRGHVEEEGIDRKIFENYSKIFSGHFHHRATQGDIMYLGCPYEMSWSDFGNQKGIHVLETDTMDVKFMANPFKIFKRFEYDDVNFTPHIEEDLTNCYVRVIVKNKSDPAKFETFIEDINKRKVCNILIEDEGFAIEDLPEMDSKIEDTITFIENSVKAMNNDSIDKEKLIYMMKDLYKQANELED